MMALPAFTPAGLAVKARAAAFACSHFYRAELRDADWDHQHVRTLIDGVLGLAGEPLIEMPGEEQPTLIDPAFPVVYRLHAADKTFDAVLTDNRTVQRSTPRRHCL
jgi:hypothetical protein